MRIGRVLLAVGLVAAVGVGGVAVARTMSASSTPQLQRVSDDQALKGGASSKEVRFALAPSSDQFRKCLPHAKVNVAVALRTDAIGKDIIKIDAVGLPAKTSLTVFFLEVPASPFGAAEYIGDLNSDKYGKAHAEFDLIVQEAFASTVVNGKRVRVDLNHMGMWFADPTGDDFCLGKGQGPVTPFDGDNEAGAQVFNSANILPNAPLPAP